MLRDTDLEGATLQMAKLFGADMQGARLGLADLSGALVWRTIPPAVDSTALADLASLVIKVPSEEEMGQTKSAVAALDAGPLKVRLANLMAPMNDAGPNGSWAASPEGQAWASLAKAERAGDGRRLPGPPHRAAGAPRLPRARCQRGRGERHCPPRRWRRVQGRCRALYERLKAGGLRASSATIPPRPGRARRRRRCGTRAIVRESRLRVDLQAPCLAAGCRLYWNIIGTSSLPRLARKSVDKQLGHGALAAASS